MLLKQPPQPLVDMPSALNLQDKQFAQAFAVINQAIEHHAFPAAALAVTHRGRLIALHGFGRFTYADDAPPVQPDSIFDLASLTKVVATTTAAMLLYERGQLPLDIPLGHFLPDFVARAPRHQQDTREAVTLRMLLAHSSGLPAYEKLFETTTSREELVRAALTTRVAAEPGTHEEYSDVGFILLGEVLARQAGLGLDQFAQQEIFVPLGMAHTRFNPPAEWKSQIPSTEEDRTFRKRILQGEVNDENAFVMGGVAGHAGVFAPAIDIARFAECMLRGGAPILKPETVQLFTRRAESPAGSSRALGWDTPSPPASSGARFSASSFGHLGFTGTSLWIDPARQLSVTLLTNRTWPNRMSQAIRQVRPVVHDAIVEALEE